MSERRRRGRRPITACHRGASALAPENTLRAFELAIEGGADMPELDVHLSADGRLDPPVDRQLVDALHAAGQLVMTNHTNDPAEALYFASIGVDVIASDDPRVLARLERS